jgi:ADP-heptose:LPS heptosyltransferase
MTATCPVCSTTAAAKQRGTPYWVCPECELWFQHPLPPKVYQHEHEPSGDTMDAREQEINRALADYLFDTVMHGKCAMSLDVGAKYPVLASRLRERGARAYAMEAHADGAAFARHLGVIGITADFENDADRVAAGSVDLVTLIHVFEHFYDPALVIRKLRRLMADDASRLFIRMPDHRVRGAEQHLSEDHFKIHPYFWTTRALLHLLAETHTFAVESARPMDGAGQTDFVLRPIDRARTLAVAMIVKNEERDLPRAMESFKPIANRFFVVDTGSTDDTVAIAVANGATVTTYTGASEKDEDGDWKLWDFSKARNHALEIAERSGDDWVMWVDADDELRTPNAIRRAMYYDGAAAYGMWIDGGGSRWIQYRMWKDGARVRFKGRCHEYAVLDGLHTEVIGESLIQHHGEPTPGNEDSNPRNLRILLREWEEEETPRTAFYIANTYRDVGRHREAAQWYTKRIEMGAAFRDEYLFAKLSLSRCLRAMDQHQLADEGSEIAYAECGWAEFAMDIANGAYQRKDYDKAIAWCLRIDTDAPIPETPLWREPTQYRDQPARLLSWCFEHIDELYRAVAWGSIAQGLIGRDDADWQQRQSRIVAKLKAEARGVRVIKPEPSNNIAIVRPGAIGDVLMSLNLIPRLRADNPGSQIHYFCAKPIGDALASVITAAGVDLIMDAAHIEHWAPQYRKVVNLVGYLQPGYPEKPLDFHIIEYFGQEMGLQFAATMSDGATTFGLVPPLPGVTRAPNLPSLTLRRPKRNAWLPKRYATLQMTAAWSPYKNWPIRRWHEVVELLPEIEFVLIGAKDDPVIDAPNVDKRFVGTSLEAAIGVIANADLHVGVDSFAQHVAHYYWQDGNRTARVPGVIVYGSTQATATGYDDYTNLVAGLPCQPCFREDPKISRMPRDPCPRMVGDVPLCMDRISVVDVANAIREAWQGSVKEAA